MTSLLIVDDDATFCAVLADNFCQRGFEVACAHSVAEAGQIAQQFLPEWALVDLSMPGASGLALIPCLLALDPATRIVILTGYASFTTGVEAIKLGAKHYLSKPVSTDEIIAAFHKQEGDPTVPVMPEAQTLGAAERDYVLGAFERNRRNVSATARELGIHRRTLQRKLDKLL